MNRDVPRNALSAAYEAADRIRRQTDAPSPNLLDIVDLLDHYSKRQPLALNQLERTTIKYLLHDTPQDGLVYVEYLFDAALAGERVLRPAEVSHA